MGVRSEPVVKDGAEPFVPRGARVSLRQLDRAADGCRGCDLYKQATQAVLGRFAAEPGAGAAGSAAARGPRTAPLMLIGEQPGDREDLEGRPFVGPAGGLLQRALHDAAAPLERIYLTNAVKHSKWTPSPRGKRRLHAKPSAGQVGACRPWLEAEVRLVRPGVLLCLGATAGRSVLGPGFRVGAARGGRAAATIGGVEVAVLATVHPSALLRIPDEADRRRAYAEFVADLKAAVAAAGG